MERKPAEHRRWRMAAWPIGTVGAALVVYLAWASRAEAERTPTGDFQRSVAIDMPPFHGLEPKLGPASFSSGPTGWVGRGWSLGGLSGIRRQSVGRGLPHWDDSDGFVLDGQDTYQTERWPLSSTYRRRHPNDRGRPDVAYRRSVMVSQSPITGYIAKRSRHWVCVRRPSASQQAPDTMPSPCGSPLYVKGSS
jgi:hypothetical protein